MEKTILTDVRLKPTMHKEFKESCDLYQASISKVLRVSVLLFLRDPEHRERVLKEIKRN